MKKIVITNTQGTDAAAIDINASAGGIDIDAEGVLALDGAGGIDIGKTTDVAIDIDSSTLDIDASGDITIDTTSNSVTALTMTTNGGIDEKIIMTNTQGTDAAAIDINASAGGIDIDAAGVLALDGAGGIDIGKTTDVAIDIDSSTLDIDASGDITIDTTSNSSTALTLTTDGGVNEKIVITNTQGTDAAAIDINASAGGIDIDAAGLIALDSSTGINLNSGTGGLIYNTSQFVIDSNENVGIGTNSITATNKLEVIGNIGLTKSIVLTGTNSLYFGNDPTGNTGYDSSVGGAEYNVALGTTALDAVTTGNSNTAVGYDTLTNCTTGSSNTAIGYKALTALTLTDITQTAANSNTAVGYESMKTCTIGHSNVGLGRHTLRDLTTGSHNIAIGRGSLNALESGTYNVVIGSSGPGSTLDDGNYNIIIGSGDVSSSSAENQIVIGDFAQGHGDNILVIGSNATREITGWHPGSTDVTDLGSNSYYFKDFYLNGSITFKNGATIVNTSSSLLTITETNLSLMGNVGIGTDSPSVNLHINSTDSIIIPVGTTGERPTSGLTAGMLRYNTTTTQFEGYSNSNWQGLGGVIDIDQDTKILAEQSSDEDKLRFITDGSERMIIDNTGLVGIGTDSPESQFHVTGSTSSNNSVLKITDTGTGTYPTSSDIKGTLTLEHETAGGSTSILFKSARDSSDYATIYYTDGNGTDEKGILTIACKNDTTGGNEDQIRFQTFSGTDRMTIAGNGNIGIGSTNPRTILDINSTDALILPVGTNAERPTGADGMIRYNTDTTQFEGYSNSNWQGLGGVIDIDQDTKILAEQSSDEDKLRFITAGSERMIIDDNGLVGIGTNAPSTKLQIGSDLSHDASHTYDSNVLKIVNPTVTSSTVLNDPQDILYLARDGTNGEAYGSMATFKLCRYEDAGTSSLGSRTRMDIDLTYDVFNDVNVMTLRSDGKVGIGTNVPTEQLEIAGNLFVNNSSGGYLIFDNSSTLKGPNKIQFNRNSSDDAEYGFGLASSTLKYHSATYHNWYIGSDWDGSSTTDSAFTMQLATDGLGIGTTPTSTLHLHKQFTASGTYPAGEIKFSTVNSGGVSWDMASIESYVSANSGGISGYPGGLAFKTKIADSNSATAVDTKMVLDAAGNLGIGTGNPQNLLHVHKASGGGMLRLKSASTNVYLGTNDGSDGYLWVNSDDDLKFGTNNTERIRILSSGNVGIGTNNPGYELDVAGDINLSGTLYGPSGILQVGGDISLGGSQATDREITFQANNNGTGDKVSLKSNSGNLEVYSDGAIKFG